jgi:hypothetical protein
MLAQADGLGKRAGATLDAAVLPFWTGIGALRRKRLVPQPVVALIFKPSHRFSPEGVRDVR